MSHHPEEPILNMSNAPHFQEVLEKGLEQPGRRQLIRGGFGLAGLGAAQAVGLTAAGALAGASGQAEAAQGMARPTTLGFAAVDKSIQDAVKLPPAIPTRLFMPRVMPLTSTCPAGRTWALKRTTCHVVLATSMMASTSSL